MRWTTRTRRSPIGADVGGRFLRAVQLLPGPGSWQVAAAARLVRSRPAQPLDGQEVRRFRDVLFRQGFAGRDVVLAVPPEMLLTNILELPPRSSGAPVEQIARAELARMHARPANSFEMGCWDLPVPARAKKGAPVMVAACGHAEADAYLDVFEGEALRVVGLEAEASAVARALRGAAGLGGGMTAVLELGWGCGLLLLLHGGTVVYQRSLTEAGLARVHRALTGQLGLDEETADFVLGGEKPSPPEGEGPGAWRVRADVQSKLASYFRRLRDELQASLSYALHQYPDAPVQRLVLLGAGARLGGLSEFMASAVSAEVRTIGLGDVARAPAGLAVGGDAPDMVKCVGLARFLEE